MRALVLVVAFAASPVPAGDDTPVVDAGSLVLSVESVNSIVRYETGGRSYYRKFCSRPEDPGYSSGVTVGFGYDLKYHTPSQIRKDWAGVASPNEIDAMASVSGKDGSVYRRIRSRVYIGWDEARVVFDRVTIPRWAANTKRAYGLSGKRMLHPHANGALVGNTFNRGTSMSGSRCREKRERRDLIKAGRYGEVPETFESETRLWRNSGLRSRRRDEARLWREALKYDWWQKK